jgi:trypsin
MHSTIFLVALMMAGASALPSFIFDNRIVNGTDAADGEFPFAVSIRRSNNGMHTCGGSILTPNFVLTAAHCVMANPISYNVLYGTNKLVTNGPNVVPVLRIKIHDHFNPFRSPEFDIGVVRTGREMTFGTNAAPVVLPYQGQLTRGGSPATTIGWGLDQTGGNIQTNLQKVDYFIQEQHICFAVGFDEFSKFGPP